MSKKFLLTTTGAIALGASALLTAPSTHATGFGDWMNPGKWFGNNNNSRYDRDYYGPGYGYPGGYGYGPGYGYPGGYGYGYGPGYGYPGGYGYGPGYGPAGGGSPSNNTPPPAPVPQ